MGVTFEQADYLLSISPNSHNEYDFIIGNPPYLNKSSAYVRKNKQELKKIYGKINSHEVYSMFIVSSIWRLKNGGKLGFITSDSFLSLITHKRLRKFILNNCIINEILLAPINLFDSQNVSTSPVIFILTKCIGKDNENKRKANLMRIIPRVESEESYDNTKKAIEYKQEKYYLLPFNIFFTDVEESVINLFEQAPKLTEFLQGFIGMHTHNNRKYIAAIEGTELAEIFRKRNENVSDLDKMYNIITEKEFYSGKWKPYLKRGGSDQYYRPVMEALDWNVESIKVYDIPKNVPFEEEGIVISGVSSRLAARYMPKGCYWDSNKAIGFIINDNSISIEYVLGLLNSSLYNYLAKGIINNTNSIQLTGIHSLPFILPDRSTMGKVENLVRKIINNKKRNINYDYLNEQKAIDEIIFNYHAKKYNFSEDLQKKLENKYSFYKYG
ncbi:MAG: hypothetical protein EU539_05430 [Promethearchaeota archaeon]|nr:MAG: hypothetical protein EU539_05430 [Candidatus Lokiarchaeota archaeon]